MTVVRWGWENASATRGATPNAIPYRTKPITAVKTKAEADASSRSVRR